MQLNLDSAISLLAAIGPALADTELNPQFQTLTDVNYTFTTICESGVSMRKGSQSFGLPSFEGVEYPGDFPKLCGSPPHVKSELS